MKHAPLIQLLATRFEQHLHRHPTLSWRQVLARLEHNAAALRSLGEMEASGGEPDVIEEAPGRCVFIDCSAESPLGRRSLCYDADALNARKENKPAGSALAMANAMGIELLDEDQYRRLQQVGDFDVKTSSWVATPPSIRSLGGALFCDKRYGQVFLYHNGAQSYYAARGFRGLLRV